MPVVLWRISRSGLSRRSAPGRRSQARMKGAPGAGAEAKAWSQYSNRSDCHFQGEDRHRFRNTATRSAGAAGESGAGLRRESQVDISTFYAAALRREWGDPVASEG